MNMVIDNGDNFLIAILYEYDGQKYRHCYKIDKNSKDCKNLGSLANWYEREHLKKLKESLFNFTIESNAPINPIKVKT